VVAAKSVSGSPSASGLVSTQTSHIATVSKPSAGIYCLAPDAPISGDADTAVASPEVSYSTSNAPGVVAVNAQHTNCPSGNFEVDTYTPGTTTPTDGYAFTVIVP
jgi:hypothetical protein